MSLTKSRKRWKLLVAGLLAVTPAVAVISCLQLRWKPPGGIAYQRLTLEGHQFPVQALTFGPDGKTLTSAACYLGATQTGVEVARWDVGTGNLVDKRLEHPGAPRCLTLAPGGQRLAATVRDRDVVLWDVGTWRERGRLEVRADSGNTIALSDDAAQLATANFQDGVTVWDAGNGRARSSWKVQVVSCLAFAPGSALLACGASDCTIGLWNPATGAAICTLRGHDRPVCTLSFSPNGRLLASGDYGGTVKLWDLAAKTRHVPRTVSADRDEAAALAFSPDSATLAVAVDRVVQLWDVATGRLLARLEGHAGKVQRLAYAPDGRRLASGGYNRTVRLWDVARFQMTWP
jgi:hypothetical protein